MPKVLFTATVVKTHIREFHIPYLKMFREQGWETAVAARNDYEDPSDCVIPYCDRYFDIPFARDPLKPANIRAYRALKKVIRQGGYDIIHCHTPVGALLTRLAARKARKTGTKVIYTAHGFHFFRGAPLLNWLVYFPIEWIGSFFTDVLITINTEDYAFAKKHMRAKRIEYVPGVGVDLDRFAASDGNGAGNETLRAGIGCGPDGILLLSVGELTENKNHATVIRALAEMKDTDVHYAIAGSGARMEQLRALRDSLGLGDRVHLLGYRHDVADWYRVSDVFVFPSFREGLSLSLMEAMASGMPVAVSRIRGNVDLIDENGGYLFDPHSVEACRDAIRKVLDSDRKRFGEHNREKIHDFSIEIVMAKMMEIYGLSGDRPKTV